MWVVERDVGRMNHSWRPMRLGPAGLEAIGRGGFVGLALRARRLPQVVMGRRHCRLERNRPLIVTDCVGGVAQCLKDVAEIVVGFGIVWSAHKRTPKLLPCLFQL